VTISGNMVSQTGGGMFVHFSNPTLSNVTISENIAFHGGGIGIQSSNPTLFQVTISGNTADNGGGEGGGMFLVNDGNPNLTNVTISGNTADNGGGIFLGNSTNATLINSIIWNNSPNSIILNSGNEEPIITYSDIDGGWVGEGNINQDPLFNDDYSLLEDSPCIDAGTADLDGNGYDDITNYFGSAPDMGAYEFEGSSLTGDLNGDGMLNILDVVMLVNIVLGYGDPLPSGDLNGDGVLNVLDVVVLVNIILGG